MTPDARQKILDDLHRLYLQKESWRIKEVSYLAKKAQCANQAEECARKADVVNREIESLNAMLKKR